MAEEWDERRKYKRAKLTLSVTVKVKGSSKSYEGIAQSVSGGGLGIALDSFLPLGKNILVSFKLNDEIKYEGIHSKVVRVQDEEDKFLIGIEFLTLPEPEKEKIEKLIAAVYFIKSIKLFASLTHDEALYLRNAGREVKFEEGKIIFNEGDDGDAFYAVVSGKVRITKKSKIDQANEEILALVREGEFFGEMALFDEGDRTASALAHVDCTLFVITVDAFNKMIKENHKLTIKVLVEFIRTLSKRLKTMNQEMVDLLFTENVIKDYKQQ